ncbi:MAG: S8 family peptidase [Hymenobacteraceae bacterium]|nr:S8 family peptidase [Hymenobacteraceae bacterium]
MRISTVLRHIGFAGPIALLWALALAPAIGQTRVLSGTNTPAGGATAEPGEIVFRLKSAYKGLARPLGIEHAGLRTALAAVGVRALRQPFPRAVAPDAKHPGSIDLTLTYRAHVPVGTSFAAVQRRLLATGVVAWVEPHYARAPLFQPNDPLADSIRVTGQYHLKNIKAYRAWDVEDGDSTVVIGITDTGTRFTHHDLGNIAFNRADPINGLDDDADGYIDNFRGWDIADNDNNPRVDSVNFNNSQPYHGTQVSGAAAGTTTNGRGIAGAGFKCRYLPIKIYNTTNAGGFAGFEGIVYAADHGCQIINCSWGGVGYRSQYEQDVITYATRNRDAVVVVAAGNTNADLDFYPASYVGVVSVASVARDDVKAPSGTYAHRISLCAPGRQILTTQYQHDSAYATTSGSSVAAPLVAGAVALVRAHFPTLTGEQAAERVRIAADTSIYALPGNANFREQLGRGRLNMHRALADTTLRSVRLMRARFAASGPAYGGDTLTLTATFRNLLAPLAGFVVSLSSPTAGVQVLAGGPVSLGPLATLDSVAMPVGQAFRVVVPASSAPNGTVALRFGFADSAGGYRDFEYVTVALNPDYVTLDSTAIAATVTSRGDLGYDHADPRYGRSVARQPGGANLLSEGGLLVGAGPDRVSDRLRSATAGRPDDDFAAVQPIRFTTPLPWAAQTATGTFADSTGPTQAGVRVSQRAWNSTYPGCEDAVVLEYGIVNQTTDTLRTLYAGLFADWDVEQFQHNVARWQAGRRLAYVTSTRAGTDTVFAALKLLTSQPAGTYAFDQRNPTAPGPVNATDGLTTAEKWAALVAAPGGPTTAGTAAGGTDVAHLVRAALPRLAPRDTVRVAWAIITSTSLIALEASADSIQALFDAAQLVPAAPVGIGASRCGPGSVTLSATGAPAGGGYRWYAQAVGGAPAPGGLTATYTVSGAATDTFYVSTVTRVGRESERVPVLAVVDVVPAAPVLTAAPQPAGTLLLTTVSGQPAQFYLNGVALAAAPTASLLLTAAAQNGVYTATIAGGAGCISAPSNAITVTVTGLANALATAIQLYPNPTNGDARLVLPLPARVTVRDALGRVVFTADAPSGEVRLPLAGQARGMYSVRLQTATATAVRRLVRE